MSYIQSVEKNQEMSNKAMALLNRLDTMFTGNHKNLSFQSDIINIIMNWKFVKAGIQLEVNYSMKEYLIVIGIVDFFIKKNY